MQVSRRAVESSITEYNMALVPRSSFAPKYRLTSAKRAELRSAAKLNLSQWREQELSIDICDRVCLSELSETIIVRLLRDSTTGQATGGNEGLFQLRLKGHPAKMKFDPVRVVELPARPFDSARDQRALLRIGDVVVALNGKRLDAFPSMAAVHEFVRKQGRALLVAVNRRRRGEAQIHVDQEVYESLAEHALFARTLHAFARCLRAFGAHLPAVNSPSPRAETAADIARHISISRGEREFAFDRNDDEDDGFRPTPSLLGNVAGAVLRFAGLRALGPGGWYDTVEIEVQHLTANLALAQSLEGVVELAIAEETRGGGGGGLAGGAGPFGLWAGDNDDEGLGSNRSRVVVLWLEVRSLQAGGCYRAEIYHSGSDGQVQSCLLMPCMPFGDTIEVALWRTVYVTSGGGGRSGQKQHEKNRKPRVSQQDRVASATFLISSSYPQKYGRFPDLALKTRNHMLVAHLSAKTAYHRDSYLAQWAAVVDIQSHYRGWSERARERRRQGKLLDAGLRSPSRRRGKRWLSADRCASIVQRAFRGHLL